ncbi:MAG: GTP 3',8-cyclase MoaA [Armatimonadota bacterium]|nr:GTP 3',8-cyclase MoaA [Armatimonadota bacterium]MDR7451636.1 GTP 3',8-cyclase MoaA [Armatimonadota bacterium]MDR7467644.1 GTP 3',8-cyclase MoaA [Armatimonadota bacterium]MDR7492605.1 GTP 3',8-cyclase MoaA [Armatimonadota bacterium]MDR7499927.1 GTP 3',8-cyclase MoaA [Armatimonadota bacterium]
MRDQYGRELTDLRISLTDRCNLRCVYCMPAEGIAFRPAEELLQDDELLRIVRIAALLGVRKVRLTGGEPTVRPGLAALVRAIRVLPGIEDIALTTNGLLLDRLAGPLAEAGLRRVNVSLDTLDPAKFAAITRGGRVEQVLAGIAAAEAAGLVPVKINTVVVRGFNDDGVAALAALTLDRPWEIRFIEMMPFSTVGDFAEAGVVKSEETMAKIEAALGPLIPVDLSGADPARTYRLPQAAGHLGFISPISNPFCARCGRLRLTADGRLRLCLLRDDEVDLLGPLRRGASDDELREIFRAGAFRRPFGHALAEQLYPQARAMIQIGG